MNTKTQEFTDNTIESIKNISRDNAIRYGHNDQELNITLTSKDIKENTDRKRVDDSVRKSIANRIESSGMNVKIEDGNIYITVSPMLAEKESYSLKDIKERESIVEELNIRESYALSN